MPALSKKNSRKLSTEGGRLKQIPEQFPGVQKLQQAKHKAQGRDGCQRVKMPKADGCQTQGDPWEHKVWALQPHLDPCGCGVKLKGSLGFLQAVCPLNVLIDYTTKSLNRHIHPRKQIVRTGSEGVFRDEVCWGKALSQRPVSLDLTRMCSFPRTQCKFTESWALSRSVQGLWGCPVCPVMCSTETRPLMTDASFRCPQHHP